MAANAYNILIIGLGLTDYGKDQSEGNEAKDGTGGSADKPDDPIAGGKEVIKPKPAIPGTRIPDGFGGKEFDDEKKARNWLKGAHGKEFKKFYRIVLLGSVHK